MQNVACTRMILCYVVHRSNAVLDRAVCFLGRFLPKLGGATSAAIFLSALRVDGEVAAGSQPTVNLLLLPRLRQERLRSGS